MAVFASNCGLFGPNIGPDREFDAIAPRKNQQENGAMVVPRYGRTKMFPISHKSFNLWPKSYLLIGPKWQIWPNICTPFRRASCPYDRASSRLFDLLNSKWSKRSVRPKMIVWSGALFTLRWSCFRLPCFFFKNALKVWKQDVSIYFCSSHIYPLTQACLSFSHSSKPLGDVLIVLDMGLIAVKSCVSIFLQNLWSLLLSCIGGHHQLPHIAPSPNGASVTRMEIKFDLSIPNRNERGTAMLVASRNILNPLLR